MKETDIDIGSAIAAGELFNQIILGGRGRVYHFRNYSPIDLGIKVFLNSKEYIYLLEHKHRSNNRQRYPTIWLSLSKYHFLVSLPLNSIPVFIVTWADVVGAINLNRITPIRTTINRRRRGNRPIDSDEILVEFDVNDFKIL